jgi:hypothetical protein
MTLKKSRKYFNSILYQRKIIFSFSALPTPQNKNHPVHKNYRRKKLITPPLNPVKNVFDGTKQQQPKL